MNNLVNDHLEDMLNRHEGRKRLPYLDSTGHMTIGVGHNLHEPMDDVLMDLILRHDVRKAIRGVITIFPELYTFGERRANVLIALMFNLGKPRFLTFKKMIAAIRAGDWNRAADELKDSKWYSQVDSKPGDNKGRGDEMVSMLR